MLTEVFRQAFHHKIRGAKHKAASFVRFDNRQQHFTQFIGRVALIAARQITRYAQQRLFGIIKRALQNFLPRILNAQTLTKMRKAAADF